MKLIVKALAGPYVHTDMIVSQLGPETIHTAYTAYMYESFSRTPQNMFWYGDHSHDFLCIQISTEELQRVSDTCEACVKTKLPYNTKDMLLSIVPLRNPFESNIFSATSLFCSQSIVLILRSCLDEGHRLQPDLKSVNSRTVTPSQLYTLMRAHCIPVSTRQILKGCN